MTASTISLSRADARRMKKLAEKIDSVIESDRRFFARHPQRRHRIRLASLPEIESHRIISPGLHDAPKGFHWFVIVKQFAPGIRGRWHFLGPASNDTDISEIEAAWLYEQQLRHQQQFRSFDEKLTSIAADAEQRKGSAA